MDPYFYEFQKELVVSSPISIIEATPAKKSTRHDQITFHFSCKQKHNRWITSTQDSTELHDLHLLEYLESPAVVKSMTFSVPKINTRRKFILRAAVFKGLEDFPLSFLERQDLSQVALNTAWDILDESSNGRHHHHHLRIGFVLTLVHDLAIDESRYINWTSEEAVEAAMIPATDASIESLRSKTIEYSNENHGSCVVCMEEFEAGCDNVVTMPCSHIFHGECIKKWLRRCHCCPVCRFEMPAD